MFATERPALADDPAGRRGAGRRRAAAGLVAAVVAAAALATLPGDPESAERRGPYPGTLAPGAGRAIAERACLLCHSAMLVTQQAKDSTGWEKSLATMIAWGAPLTPAERDSLRDYLRASYGRREPPR